MGPYEALERSRVVEIRRRLRGSAARKPEGMQIIERGRWANYTEPSPIEVYESERLYQTVQTQKQKPAVDDVDVSFNASTPLKTKLQAIKEICDRHGVTVHEVRGPGRSRPVAAARHEVTFTLYYAWDMSLAQIGRLLGDRDHTTVLASVRLYMRRFPDKAAEVRARRDEAAALAQKRRELAIAAYMAGPISLTQMGEIAGVSKHLARKWVMELTQ